MVIQVSTLLVYSTYNSCNLPLSCLTVFGNHRIKYLHESISIHSSNNHYISCQQPLQFFWFRFRGHNRDVDV